VSFSFGPGSGLLRKIRAMMCGSRARSAAGKGLSVPERRRAEPSPVDSALFEEATVRSEYQHRAASRAKAKSDGSVFSERALLSGDCLRWLNIKQTARPLLDEKFRKRIAMEYAPEVSQLSRVLESRFTLDMDCAVDMKCAPLLTPAIR